MTRTVTIWAAAIGLIVAMSYAGGCSIDEIVTVDVPPNTREHFRENLEKQVPAEVTLRDARILRSEGDRILKRRLEQQAADHQASNDALDAEIADGTFIEGLINSTINTGIDMAIPGIGNMPGGAIITTLLAGLGMWMAPRPGDGKRLKAAEDKGYDMGRKETVETVKTATS